MVSETHCTDVAEFVLLGDVYTMSYDVIIPDKIQRVIRKKLDKSLERRLIHKLLKLETAPLSYGKPLRHPLAGIWEIYFEKKWRVLFEVDENEHTVIIVGFKHKDEMT